jgi:hypothetical protein
MFGKLIAEAIKAGWSQPIQQNGVGVLSVAEGNLAVRASFETRFRSLVARGHTP